MCVVAVAENHLSLLQTKVQNHVHGAVDDDDAAPGGNRPCSTQPGSCKNWNACYVGLWKEWQCDDRVNELKCGQLGGPRSTNTWCPVAAPETTTAAPAANGAVDDDAIGNPCDSVGGVDRNCGGPGCWIKGGSGDLAWSCGRPERHCIPQGGTYCGGNGAPPKT